MARISSLVFEINCASVTVLSVLYEKDHQKRDDGGARVDNELPSVRENERTDP